MTERMLQHVNARHGFQTERGGPARLGSALGSVLAGSLLVGGSLLLAGCNSNSGGGASGASSATNPSGTTAVASKNGSHPANATGAKTTGATASTASNTQTGASPSLAVVQGGSAPIFEARGLYATGWSAGLPKKLDNLIQIIHRTGLNSLVIDVKDSDGAVSYYTPGVPLAVSIGACSPKPHDNRCADIDAVLKKLKSEHIHSIGRIVCFSDPILAAKHHEWAIRSKNGGLWRGRKGYWVDPTVPQVQQYDIDLAIDAAKRGFDEVQWDYVRFPSDGNTKLCVYHKPVGKDRFPVIADYLKDAYAALQPYHVPVTADIFGLTGTAKSDMGIGQKINPIADHVDAISPMVYPSHFAHGEYHMPDPNTQPYKTVFLSLRDARKRISGSHAQIRPWIQAFSLFGVHYGPDQFMDELKAVRDDHLSQFLCWNANNKYDIVEQALTQQSGKALLAQIAANGNQSSSTEVQKIAEKTP